VETVATVGQVIQVGQVCNCVGSRAMETDRQMCGNDDTRAKQWNADNRAKERELHAVQHFWHIHFACSTKQICSVRTRICSGGQCLRLQHTPHNTV
jgi:hypothetical protein